MHALLALSIALLTPAAPPAPAPAPDPNGFSHIHLICQKDDAYLHAELAAIVRGEGLTMVLDPYGPFVESQLLCALTVDWSAPVTVHVWITDMDGRTVHDGRGECAYDKAASVKAAGLEALCQAMRPFCMAYTGYDPAKVYPKRHSEVMAELRAMRDAVREAMREAAASNAAAAQKGPIARPHAEARSADSVQADVGGSECPG